MDKNFLNSFKSQVEDYQNQGVSKTQAISLVAKKMNLNPFDIASKIYPNLHDEDKDDYEDIKTKEGTFVELKNDPEKKQYEVININNKDAIILRDIISNREISASEMEITPVIMENNMNKINEAQYSVSINNLETQDAATLSQMLNLANQAETSTMDADVSGMAVEKAPIDMNNGLPLDMSANDELPMDAPMGLEEPSIEEPIIDDIEFDEELPTEVSIEEPMGLDEPVVEEPSIEEPINDEIVDAENYNFDDEIAEALKAAGIELSEAKEVIPSDKGEQEKYAEEITEEDEGLDDFADEELEEGISDYLPKAGLIRDDETNKAQGAYVAQGTKDQLEKAKIIAKVKFANGDRFGRVSSEDLKNFDEYYKQYLEIYGDDELSYGELEESVDLFEDKIVDFNSIIDYMEQVAPECGFYDQKDRGDETILVFDMPKDKENIKKQLKDKFGNEVNFYTIQSEYAPEIKSFGIGIKEVSEPNFDDEIAEALKLAGIELNEAESAKPLAINDETLYINKDNEDSECAQTPEYKEVNTDDFGKEASEGMKLMFESTFNKAKIQSIYETAKSMYAKKDSSEWNLLDRRYIEKLIKEGCSYDTSSRMIMEAKKGK